MTEFPPRTLYGIEGGDGRDMPPGCPPDNSGVGRLGAATTRSGGVPTPDPASIPDAGQVVTGLATCRGGASSASGPALIPEIARNPRALTGRETPCEAWSTAATAGESPASLSDAGGQPSPRDERAGEGAPASEPPHPFPPLDHPWWPARCDDRGGLLAFMAHVSVRYVAPVAGGATLCIAAWMAVDAMAPQFAALAWALGG